MEVAHIDVFRREPERFWHFYGNRFTTLREKQPNGAHFALAELERRGLLDAVITQNIDGLHEAAGTQDLVEVHGSISHSSCLECGRRYELEETRAAAGRRRARRAALRLRPSAEARRRAVRRVPADGRDGAGGGAVRARRPAAVRRLVARGLPGGRAAVGLPAGGRRAGDRHPGARRSTTTTPRCGSRATWSPSSRRSSRRSRVAAGEVAADDEREDDDGEADGQQHHAGHAY